MTESPAPSGESPAERPAERPVERPVERPNILYLHTHDTGRMISPYGHNVPTPRLQEFAEGSAVFRRAFSAAPSCSPSRAALLTGQWPHEAGMMGLAHMGWSLHDRSHHLIHTLHRGGYTSAMIGVQHVAQGPHEGVALGYHEHLPITDHTAAPVADAAERYLERTHEQPFFLSVGFVETHTLPDRGHTFGYEGRSPGAAPIPPTLPDTPVTRSDMASFCAAAEEMDTAMGRVLDALQRNGLAHNTIVIVTTDHGVALPGMKSTLSDLGTGVLLMLRYPGMRHTGPVDALVSQIDLFPTVCDLVGLTVPEWVRGHSLVPSIEHGVPARTEVFAETTYHVAYEPARSIRTDRWRYVRRFSTYRHPILPNVDDTPSKGEWVAAGVAARTVPPESLFDVVLDPLEREDLATDASHAAVLDSLRDRLDQWMRETHDPILDGPIPEPEGYPYVAPDRTSPEEVNR